MEQHKTIVKLLSLLVVGTVLLSACGAGTPETSEEIAPDPFQDFEPIVSATGQVTPARWALLSLPSSGVVEDLPVEVGAEVQQGDLLLTLSGRSQAEAAVSAARLELVSSVQALDILIENEDMARALAEQELANARDELKDADYMWRVRQEGFRASQETIDAAEANLVLAENEVERAERAYNRYSGRSEDDPARALALSNLAGARQKRDGILRNLNWYKGSPTELQQSMLDADVAVAQARLAEAERLLVRMQNGPDSRELDAAEARVANAEAQLTAAESTVADLELLAPFDGVVTEVYVRANEWIAPGQPVLLIADLTAMRVETTDLNEIDAAQVELGNPVSVTFDALPDLVVDGTVTRISPKASEGSGVNFTVVVELSQLPAPLRWGMTAFVDIEVANSQ